MDAEKIVKLTHATLQTLLDAQHVESVSKSPNGKRKEERWPFPGTIEVWLPETCYGDLNFLATLHNLSLNGLAMRSRRPIPVGTRFELALHLPELSTYGAGIVRHCTQAPSGFLIGVEFSFESDDE